VKPPLVSYPVDDWLMGGRGGAPDRDPDKPFVFFLARPEGQFNT